MALDAKDFVKAVVFLNIIVDARYLNTYKHMATANIQKLCSEPRNKKNVIFVNHITYNKIRFGQAFFQKKTFMDTLKLD